MFFLFSFLLYFLMCTRMRNIYHSPSQFILEIIIWLQLLLTSSVDDKIVLDSRKPNQGTISFVIIHLTIKSSTFKLWPNLLHLFLPLEIRITYLAYSFRLKRETWWSKIPNRKNMSANIFNGYGSNRFLKS